MSYTVRAELEIALTDTTLRSVVEALDELADSTLHRAGPPVNVLELSFNYDDVPRLAVVLG